MKRGVPLVRRVPLRTSKRIPAVSTRRRTESVPRREMVRGILRVRPVCEARRRWVDLSMRSPGSPAGKVGRMAVLACAGRSQDVHEPHTRARGGSIVDPDNALAVCRSCHSILHAEPAAATEAGLLIPSWEGAR